MIELFCMFLKLFIFTFISTSFSAAPLTTELQFSNNVFKMKELPLAKDMMISKLEMNELKGKEVIWMKMEASPKESIETICKYDNGKIIVIALQNAKIKGCFSKDKDIGFKTAIYKGLKISNVHRFQFPKGITKAEIDNFFSKVKYTPKVLKK